MQEMGDHSKLLHSLSLMESVPLILFWWLITKLYAYALIGGCLEQLSVTLRIQHDIRMMPQIGRALACYDVTSFSRI